MFIYLFIYYEISVKHIYIYKYIHMRQGLGKDTFNKIDGFPNEVNELMAKFDKLKGGDGGVIRGIKHDFPFINIRKVPREVL